MTIFSLNSDSVNDWFLQLWQLGRITRYRIIDTASIWFSLSDFELFPGLVFGDTTLLTSEVKQTLKTLGIFHALSASGSNVGVVAKIADTIAFIRARTITSISRVLCMLVYLFLVGQTAPILRAVLARIYIECGRLFHQQTHPLYGWLFAFIVLILARPTFIVELSFQLSVLAALGIHLCMPKESKDNHQLKGLAAQFREAFWQTASAQFFVAPLLVLVLGDSPTSALFVNTISAPILSILTWLAFVLAVFGALYGLLQAYNDLFLLFVQPVILVIVSAYRLTNQSFNWVIGHTYQPSVFLNHHLPFWVMMGFLIIVFAVHWGKTLQRMKYPSTLIDQWSRIAHA